MTLIEEDGKTKFKLRAVINNPTATPKMAIEGMQGGFTQQLDKLNILLAAQSNR